MGTVAVGHRIVEFGAPKEIFPAGAQIRQALHGESVGERRLHRGGLHQDIARIGAGGVPGALAEVRRVGVLRALVVVAIITEAEEIPVRGIRSRVEVRRDAAVREHIEVALQCVARADDGGHAAHGLRIVTLLDIVEGAGHAAVLSGDEHAELLLCAELHPGGEGVVGDVVVMIGQPPG